MYLFPSMSIRISLIIFIIFILGLTESVLAKYKISAKAAIFSNSTKVVRYYGKRVHDRIYPASTVKVMTALLVLETLPLNKQVKVSKRATYPQPSKIHVKVGEKYCIRDLLHAILLNSANDAAVVLAEAVSGSEENFVKLMNRRAKQLGIKHTKFTNAHGLPSKKGRQYSTAYDMYLIFRQAIKHQFFKQAIKKRYKTIYSTTGRKIRLKNHNKMLFKGWKSNLYGKTGWTKRAKKCFIGYILKGKDVCIMALFGATNRWHDIRYIVEKYGKIDL